MMITSIAIWNEPSTCRSFVSSCKQPMQAVVARPLIPSSCESKVHLAVGKASNQLYRYGKFLRSIDACRYQVVH